MYFPVADIEVAPWVPPLVAFGISFCTSMGGVSGAFMLLPFQVSILGFNTPAVSATNHLFNIVAIPSGVYRYIKERRMIWPLTLAVIIGTLPGVFIGSLLRIEYLPDPVTFKRFAAVVLLYIGVRLVREIFQRSSMPAAKIPREQYTSQFRVSGQRFTLSAITFSFNNVQYRIGSLPLMGLSLAVGMVGGVYGIGGGAIIAPFLVTFFGLPVYSVAGAALAGTLLTSVAGVAFFHMIAPFYPEMAIAPDWQLGLLFGLGGAAGMYCGARLQRFVPARLIKSILAFAILFTAVRYLNIL